MPAVLPAVWQCPQKVTTGREQILAISKRTKSLGYGQIWQVTCIFRVQLSFSLKELRLFADLTHVPESNLLETFAKAHSSVVYEASTAEHEWISYELEKRVQATERQFGVDMVPETDDSLGL